MCGKILVIDVPKSSRKECVEGVKNCPSGSNFREGVMNFMRFFHNLERVEQFKTRYQKHHANDEDELERYGFFKKSKRVSRSMMIKAKNIIMKERIWITVKLTLGGLIPAYCAGPLDTSQMTGESLLVTTRKGDKAPT